MQMYMYIYIINNLRVNNNVCLYLLFADNQLKYANEKEEKRYTFTNQQYKSWNLIFETTAVLASECIEFMACKPKEKYVSKKKQKKLTKQQNF